MSTLARHLAAAAGAFLALTLSAGTVRAAEAEADRPAKDGEPKVQRTVIEDDATRIEELKVRGQTQRITVTPKGLKSYEILPADQGRDMSDSASSQRGAAGKRVWHVMSF
ncbi:hypothetical protein [Piscinibacter terrae]|nr:hypothetical protein [Albitalea terrae]